MLKNKLHISLVIGFIFLSIIFYSQAGRAFFVSDDWHWLSVAVESSGIWPDLMTNSIGEQGAGSYNPIATLWINGLYRMFSLNSLPYHLGSFILHGINAWLIFILVCLLFRVYGNGSNRTGRGVGFLAGLLFLIWPTHVEAVSWIASVPHLLATFFYLLTLICYIKARKSSMTRLYLVAMVTSLMAMLSKEIAITLPFAIILWELWYQLFIIKRFSIKDTLWSFVFLLPLALYLVMRFMATGLLFGSYAEKTLVLRPWQVINTGLTFFEEMLTLGLARRVWMDWYWLNPIMVTALGVIVVLLIIWLVTRMKKKYILLSLVTFVLSLLPFLPLGFNRMSSEAERYTYLPSVFYIVGLAFFIFQIRSYVLRWLLVILIFLVSTMMLLHKTNNWQIAGVISSDIVSGVHAEIDRHGAENDYLLVGLPDNLSGAHIFRNNIREAMAITQPGMSSNLTLIPAYQQLNKYNYRDSILAWEIDERGYKAVNTSGKLVVTGIDRQETEQYIYELWNYDYTKFSSDTIRLILKNEFKEKFDQGGLYVLTWDEGQISIVK